MSVFLLARLKQKLSRLNGMKEEKKKEEKNKIKEGESFRKSRSGRRKKKKIKPQKTSQQPSSREDGREYSFPIAILRTAIKKKYFKKSH